MRNVLSKVVNGLTVFVTKQTCPSLFGMLLSGVELQRCRITRLVFFSLYFTPKIVRRQRRWKMFNFNSYLRYVVQVSAPYKNMLSMHA